MSKITWKSRSYAGVDGYISGRTIRAFLIYAPGDPCNFGRNKNQWELRSYLDEFAKYGVITTYHPNLAAAKRAADRRVDKHLGIKRPRVRRALPVQPEASTLKFTWVPATFFEHDLVAPGIPDLYVGQTVGHGNTGPFAALSRGKTVGKNYKTILEAQLAAEAYHFAHNVTEG